MSSLVYLSHSYRARDARINDYFVRLMESEDLIPSLDPPSTFVNSAKLERHLGQSDAMIAILTERESGISPHILYEISLCVRARKPLLAFIEDTLPSNVVPPQILQRRFSFRSFPRHVREHRQSLTILRDYIGEPPPRYQGLATPRTCLLLGSSAVDGRLWQEIQEYLQQERSYSVSTSDAVLATIERHPIGHDALRDIDLVIAFSAETFDRRDSYLYGIMHGACRPLIAFSGESTFPPSGSVPSEYKPRPFGTEMAVSDVFERLGKEIELYEEDFLDLDDAGSADRYIKFLIELGGHGRYGARTRHRGMEVVMGDKYDVHGQAAAVGPNAHVHDVSLSQVWEQVSHTIDLEALAAELAQLRVALRAQAASPADDQVVADLGQAEVAARSGQGQRALQYLTNVGKWALSAASSIGAEVAAAAIKAAAGLP